jgi:hypothetical protein
VLPERVQRGLEEVDVVHAGNLDRILEREEDALAAPALRRHLEQVLPLYRTSPPVTSKSAAGQHVGERALAGAVGPHDRVDLAGVHRQVQTLEDFALFDPRV